MTPSLTATDLETYRANVKAELNQLEKERKALLGQQKALSTRFSEVAGKFQLLKQMESAVQIDESIPVEAATESTKPESDQ